MIILKDLMDLPGLNNLMEISEEGSYDHPIKGISFVFHEKDIAHIKEGNLVICSDCLEPAVLLPLIPVLAAKKQP